MEKNKISVSLLDRTIKKAIITSQNESYLMAGRRPKLKSSTTRRGKENQEEGRAEREVTAARQKIENLAHPDSQMARLLLNTGRARMLANGLDEMTQLEPEIAFALVEAGYAQKVVSNLESFEKLSHSRLIECLIGAGKGRRVASQFRRFNGVNENRVALRLIEAGYARDLVEFFTSFHDLDDKVATGLIRAGHISVVGKYLSRFKNLSATTALHLLEGPWKQRVVAYADRFDQQGGRALAQRMIELKGAYFVATNLKGFKRLSGEIALQLIDQGYWDEVRNNSDSFEVSDSDAFSEKIEELEQRVMKGVNNKLVRDLIEEGVLPIKNPWVDVERYCQMSQSALAQCLDTKDLADNLDRFQDLDGAIAFKIIDSDVIPYHRHQNHRHQILSNLDHFLNLDHNKLARKLMEEGSEEILLRYLGNFKDLDPELLNELQRKLDLIDEQMEECLAGKPCRKGRKLV